MFVLDHDMFVSAIAKRASVGVSAQNASVTEFASHKTAPFLAKTLPSTVDPVFNVMNFILRFSRE
jgi:hypothetical protein